MNFSWKGIGSVFGFVLGAISFVGPIAEVAFASDRLGETVLSQRDLPSVNADDETADEAELSGRVLVPGTRVSLVPPVGFLLSEQFSGFVDEGSLSSITLAELPLEAYLEISEALSSTPEKITELFAGRGVVLEVESVSTVVVEGTRMPFVKGVQTVADTRVQKHFALVSAESTTLITFNIVGDRKLSEEAAIAAIQSIEIGPAPSTQQKISELPFTFETADPFEVLEVLLGSGVLLSPGGKVDPAGEAPLIIIANSVSPVQVADVAEYSTYLLDNTDGFAGAMVTDQSPVEFAGGDGYFTRATLEGDTVLQYLAIRPDDFYIRMVVVGRPEEIERLMPTIEVVRKSVATK